MHALGECECCFKPTDFLNLLELHREWFRLLIELGCAGGNRYQVQVMLIERSTWLRN